MTGCLGSLKLTASSAFNNGGWEIKAIFWEGQKNQVGTVGFRKGA